MPHNKMWTGGTTTTARKDQQQRSFLPSSLFVNQENDSLPPPPPPSSSPPLSSSPLPPLWSHNDSSSPLLGISRQCLFSKKKKKSRYYLDLSRSTLPTRRGREKVIRESSSPRADTKTFRQPQVTAQESFEEEVNLVREYRKAREQRLLLDHVEGILKWLATTTRKQQEEAFHKDAFLRDDCYPLSGWRGNDEMENLLEGETDNDEQDNDFLLFFDDKEVEQHQQDRTVQEITEIVDWQSQQEMQMAEGGNDSVPSITEFSLQDCQQEQHLLLDQTAQLQKWLIQHEREPPRDVHCEKPDSRSSFAEKMNEVDSGHADAPNEARQREQLLLCTATTQILSWLVLQEDEKVRSRSIPTCRTRQDSEFMRVLTWWTEQEKLPAKRRAELEKALCKRDQYLLVAETSRLLDWLLQQEKQVEKDLVLEGTSRILAWLVDQEAKKEEQSLAQKNILAEQALPREETVRLVTWLFDQENLIAAPAEESLTSCTGPCTSIETGGVSVDPEKSKRQVVIPSDQNVTVHDHKHDESSDKLAPLVVTPATVSTSRSSLSTRSSSHSLLPLSNEQQLVDQCFFRTPSMANASPRISQSSSSERRLNMVTPTTPCTKLVKASPTSSSAIVRVLDRSLVVTPTIVSANGTQRQSASGTKRNVSKSEKATKNRRSNGNIMQPPGTLSSFLLQDRNTPGSDDDDAMQPAGTLSCFLSQDRKTPGKLKQSREICGDDESAVTCISGLEGPRLIKKNLFRSPSSSIFPENDVGYLHAQKAGVLWQSLVGQHIRFPKHWWNGSRVPQMGVENVLPDGSLPPEHQWKYVSLDYCSSNPVLNWFVRRPDSRGRLLLHVVVRDETWRPIQDIAVGCYYPTTSRNKNDPNLLAKRTGDCRAVWMGVRNRSVEGAISLIDPLLNNDSEDSTSSSRTKNLLSPLGSTSRLGNNDLRPVFGEKPPKKTVFILESELVKRIRKARELQSNGCTTTSLWLLETFLTPSPDAGML